MEIIIQIIVDMLCFLMGYDYALKRIREKKINGYWFIPIKKETIEKLMKEKENNNESNCYN